MYVLREVIPSHLHDLGKFPEEGKPYFQDPMYTHAVRFDKVNLIP